MKYIHAILFIFLLASCDSKKEIILQRPVAFKSGDHVTAVGNSLTHQGIYLKNLMLYYMTRYPDQPVYFFNAGTSGDTAEDVNERMERDILNNNTNVFILMIGMNDAFRSVDDSFRYVWGADDQQRHEKSAKIVEKYSYEVNHAVSNLKTQARELILFTPSMFDNTAEYKYGEKDSLINHHLRLFGEHIKTFANDPQIKVVDMWSPMMEMNAKMQADDPQTSIVSNFDRVHPDEFGAFLMGCTFLKTLNESAIVSTIRIDAAKKKLADSFNATVSELKVTPDDITFDLLENALPFPLNDKIEANVDTYMGNFWDELNREILQIDHLKPGAYVLSIDSVMVGNYTSDELAAGVNLSKNKHTPQYKQAEQVSALLETYRDKNQNQVRIIKFVETTLFKLLAPDFNQWDDPQACIAQAAYIKANPKLKHWGKGSLDTYLRLKPIETELVAELDSLLTESYRISHPRVRHYEITQASTYHVKVSQPAPPSTQAIFIPELPAIRPGMYSPSIRKACCSTANRYCLLWASFIMPAILKPNGERNC
jgi:endoglucanase